eukprot:scaffold47414_cov48-Phaeocystis_antarctica.AAC.1
MSARSQTPGCNLKPNQRATAWLESIRAKHDDRWDHRWVAQQHHHEHCNCSQAATATEHPAPPEDEGVAEQCGDRGRAV